MKAIDLNPLDGARKPRLRPERIGDTCCAWKDDIGSRYSALADDGQVAAKKREASMLLSIAEGHLEDEEDYAEALRTGREALKVFREIQNDEGSVDALRIIVDAAHFAAEARNEKEPQKEALEIAMEELARFKEQGNKRGQAAMMLSLAMLNISVRGGKKRDEGVRQSKEALAACRELGDKSMEATMLLAMLRIYSMQRNRSETLAAASRAQALFQELGDRKGEGRASHALGVARFDDEQFDGAMQSFKGALVIFRELGDKKLEALERNAMAQWYLQQDQAKEALTESKEALAIAQDVGQNKAWHTQILGTIIDAYVKNKEPEAGVKLVKKSLATFREAGDARREIEALDLLANALVEEKDADSALSRAEEALSLARDINDKRLQVTILLTIGRIQFERRELTEALSCVKEMVPVCMAINDPGLEAAAHHLAVSVHVQREKWPEAMKAAKEAKELLTKAGDKHAEGRALMVMSTVHRNLQEEDQSVSASTEAQFIFQKEKDKQWEARALFEIAEVQALAQNSPAALRAVKKALILVQELDDRESQATVLCMMATIQLAMFIEQCLANPRSTPPVNAAEEVMKAQEKALDFCQKTGEKRLMIPMMFGVAQVHIVCKRMESALTKISTAEQLCVAQGDQEGEVVAMILTAYCHLGDQNTAKAKEVADKALAQAKQGNYEMGQWLANNVMAIVEQMTAAGGAGGGDGEAEVDPEMLKLKINDVANSLMGIESLAGDTPLMDAGLDSLSMVEFRNELVKEFPGVDLPGALLFDYPTVNSLADFIGEGIKRTGKALK